MGLTAPIFLEIERFAPPNSQLLSLFALSFYAVRSAIRRGLTQLRLRSPAAARASLVSTPIAVPDQLPRKIDHGIRAAAAQSQSQRRANWASRQPRRLDICDINKRLATVLVASLLFCRSCGWRQIKMAATHAGSWPLGALRSLGAAVSAEVAGVLHAA